MRIKLAIFALFLAAAAIIPAAVKAAPSCYCRYAFSGACNAKWAHLDHITTENSCTLTCQSTQTTNGQPYYDRWEWIEAGTKCTHKALADGSCVNEMPDNPSCADAYSCFCAFKTSGRGSGGYPNISCEGRMWKNEAGTQAGTSGTTCRDACTSYLGHTAANGVEYRLELPPNRALCYYDRIGDNCSNTDIDNGIENYGANWEEFITQSCTDDACRSAARKNSVCSPVRCSCTYPAGFAVETCRGKPIAIGMTASDLVCTVTCKSLGLEFGSTSPVDGPPLCNYVTASIYNAGAEYDKCAKPVDARADCSAAEAAAKALASQAKLGDDLQARGTALSLPLPFSDITLQGVIGRVLNAILGIVGAIALLMFVWGGVMWMTAAGSQEKVGKAQQTLMWAAIGLIAIFSSYAVLNLVIQTFSK